MASLGKHWKLSKETREKIRLSKLGNKNPMFGTGGYWLGKKREDMIGNKNPAKRKEIGRKISKKLKGRIMGKEWREKISKGTKESYKNGRKSGFEIMWEKYPNLVKGKNNYAWKGNEVSYRNLHRWVERYLGKPDKCDDCGESGLKGRQIHWANISGKYKRKLNDWIRLCAKCHKKFDNKN